MNCNKCNGVKLEDVVGFICRYYKELLHLVDGNIKRCEQCLKEHGVETND